MKNKCDNQILVFFIYCIGTVIWIIYLGPRKKCLGEYFPHIFQYLKKNIKKNKYITGCAEKLLPAMPQGDCCLE